MHFITNGGNSLERLKDLNVKVSIMKFETGLKNFLYYYSNKNYLNKYIRENKINLIHTHHRYPEFLAYRLSLKNDIKTITTAHSIVKKYKNISFKSERIIAVSETVKKNILQNFNIDENKIEVLYNFPFFKPLSNGISKSDLGIENKKVLLYIGRMLKDKGVDILLRSFNDLKGKYNLSLVLIGSKMDKDISKLYQSDKKNILFLGEIEDVASYYKLSDVVILPTLNEPFGLTMVEAGYFNKPFIGSNSGGISEFITSNKEGLLFKKGDVHELSLKIETLLNDSVLSSKIANNLHNKVLNNLSIDKYYQSLTYIYKNL